MGTFALQVAEFAKKAKGNADLVVRKVAIDAATSIVLKSPVDTGRFRANWVTSIGAVDETTFDAVDPTGSESIAAAAASVSDFTCGPSIFITNALPYALRLENGYSQQAPNGMVRLTFVELQDFIDRATKGLV